MKIGFQVVFFLILLNMVSGLAYTVSIAGTEYGYSLAGTGDPEDYQKRMNPEKFINQTKVTAYDWLPFLGTVVNMILGLWDAIRFVFAGFPALLLEYGAMIPDAAARAVYNAICLVIIATQSFIVFAWLVQTFSGRRMQD